MVFQLRALLLLFLLSAAVLQSATATNYAVQAVLDLSGPNAAQYAQWKQSIQLAASEINTAWAPSNTLQVDFYNTQGDSEQLQNIGAAALSNASVVALLTDEIGRAALSGFATSSQLALLVVPSAPLLTGGTSSSSTSFFFKSPRTIIGTLQALLSQYSWTKLGLLHSADDDGLSYRSQILALPGTTITTFSMPTGATDQTMAAQAVVAERMNVVIMANRQTSQVSAWASNTFVSTYLTLTSSTIVYLNELSTLPSFMPVGTFVIDDADAVFANRSTFQTKIGASTLLKGSLTAFDALKAFALAIDTAAASGPVNRATINSALKSIDYWGYGGRIQFDGNGNKIGQLGEIWNANTSSTAGTLTLSMVNTENGLTTILSPVFGGGTLTPTDDEVVFIPIVTMLALTTPIIPPSSRPALVSLFEYYVYWINKQPDLLPPKTKLLNAVIDTAGSPAMAVQLSLIAPQIGSAAVFGDYSAALTPVIQSVVSAYNMPQMSTTTGASLSNKALYPTLSRVVSSSVGEGEVILALAQQFQWTDLTLISTSENVGSDAAQIVLNQASMLGITIENQVVLNTNTVFYDAQLLEVWKNKPQVVVLLASSDTLADVLASWARTGYRPAAVVTDVLSTKNVTSLADAAGIVDASLFEGWIQIASPVGVGAQWNEFVYNSSLEDPYTWGAMPLLLENILTAAIEMDSFRVLASAIKTVVENGGSPTNGTALLAAIRAFDGNLFSGDVSFDANGDRLPTFDVFNSYHGSLVRLGRWSSESGLSLTRTVVWPDGSTNVPLSYIPRIQTWLKWSSGAGIVFATLAIIGMLLCAATLCMIYMWRESPIITSATYEFLILMLFGAALGFGSTLTWIGKPHPYICALRVWLPPIAFLLIIAPLMAKTWRLWKIFTLRDLKVVPVPLRTLILIVTGMVLVQIIICIVWISMGTIQPHVVNDANDLTTAYVLCGSNKANRIASYVTFGYIGFVLLIGCFLAFKIRKLPRDFNESKWIGRTLYNVFLFAGLIIILGYALSRFYMVVLILICVATLAICYGSIILMMAPKIFTLIKHPEKRSSSSEASTKNTEMRSGGYDSVVVRSPSDRSRERDRSRSKGVASKTRSTGSKTETGSL